MSKDFDFSQLEKFAKNWNKGVNELDQFYRGFLTEIAYRIFEKTKDRQAGKFGTPPAVKTGAMLNAWRVGKVRSVGRNVEIDITNFMDYASFVEFGARNVDGTWRDGRFMLTISMDEIQQQMPLRFQKNFAAWLTERGMA